VEELVCVYLKTSSIEQMNTNKKNEYYSSEDTVKVKIGEKLTWKRVVAFFDRNTKMASDRKSWVNHPI
jgi:hypothetical protein